MRRILTRRAGLAAMLAGVVGLASGCNIGALSYFLTPEQPLPAKIKHLATKDKKKESKVVILTYARAGDVPADFIHADRQLSELLGKNLQTFAQRQEETITVIPPRKVEEFKNANPDWKQMDLAAVGRRLGADHVIYLELNALKLYEHGSGNSLFRGRANLMVNLADVSKPDDPPAQEIYACTFPSDASGPVPVGIDMQPMQFRQAFLTHVARQLSWYFCNYPRSEQRLIDPVF